MKRSVQTKGRKTAVGRTGKPLNIYLPPAQAGRLHALAKERHIAMSNIVRFALDRLFQELDGGQLNLPLGLGL